MNQALLVLHLLGLGMGLSVPFANIVFGGLLAQGNAGDQATFYRFMPRMGRVGDIGLVLMWITGPTLVFTKYGGFAGLPGIFHAKLLAVVILTIGIGIIHANMRKAVAGDATANARIQLVAKAITFPASLIALICAVLAFNPA
jgi:uncharacterized membrane protein